MLLTKTIVISEDEPVTVDEVKVSARIDTDIDELDGQIETLIQSARLTAEHECERVFRPHAIQLGYDTWPHGNLPVPPEVESASAQIFDGTEWVPAPSRLIRYLEGTVAIVPTADLPPLPDDGSECVRVVVEVGCPANVRAYIIAMASHQLTTATAARPANPPAYLAGLLDRERNWE